MSSSVNVSEIILPVNILHLKRVQFVCKHKLKLAYVTLVK